ncbi:hypothetical protein CXY01_35860 [Cellulomonas xylanilytica]|uniref:Uncharacterized protein n=1 Tax=Cellulomonas xylanilytica TaxID=233583 RepID=A0A510V8G9_9CELL|nr:hypothetical protein CXY01_35860 [Cellulomonas xylanilytica]
MPCEISGPAACAVGTSGVTVAYDRSIAITVNAMTSRRRVRGVGAMRLAVPADRVMVMLLGSSQKVGGCTAALLRRGGAVRAGVDLRARDGHDLVSPVHFVRTRSAASSRMAY